MSVKVAVLVTRWIVALGGAGAGPSLSLAAPIKRAARRLVGALAGELSATRQYFGRLVG